MTKRFVENQLGLFFSVGPASDAADDLLSERHSRSYAALDMLFNEKGMGLFGKSDPTVSEDFRYLPLELCECDWDGQDEDGQVVYSVWFHSTSPFTPEDAVKLRELAKDAYEAGCGPDAAYVRAELFEKFEESTRRPFPL